MTSLFGSFSKPQKCSIFVENIGRPSSIWFRIYHEKAKILHLRRGRDYAGNTTSGANLLYNFQSRASLKSKAHSAVIAGIYTAAIAINIMKQFNFLLTRKVNLISQLFKLFVSELR